MGELDMLRAVAQKVMRNENQELLLLSVLLLFTLAGALLLVRHASEIPSRYQLHC